MAKRTGLGKGLDALFIDNQTDENAVSSLKISQIEPNSRQPRTDFDDAALRELADSIRVHGVLQPLVVRPLENGGYQIVAGERRWRASRMAGLSEVPVIVREFNDSQALEVAIIENLQREDLNVVELACGYKSLMDEYSMTQEQVAEKVGKSRPVIANTIRILNLPESVQDSIRSGDISKGHAKALLSLDDEELIIETAGKIIGKQMPVRDVERLARENKTNKKSKAPSEKQADPIWGDNYYKEMEMALSTELGRKVNIVSHGKKSTVSIEFYNSEELADIAARLSKSSW